MADRIFYLAYFPNGPTIGEPKREKQLALQDAKQVLLAYTSKTNCTCKIDHLNELEDCLTYKNLYRQLVICRLSIWCGGRFPKSIGPIILKFEK